MADVNIVIGAKDMASQVMRDVSTSTRVMTRNVESMSASVVASTRVMSTAFLSLAASVAVLAASMFTIQAAIEVFKFLRESVLSFTSSGTPAGERLAVTFAQVSEAVKVFMQAIGQVLAPFLQVGSELVIVFAQAVSQSLVPAMAAGQYAMDAMRPYIEAFKVNMISAITAIEVGLTNFGDVWDYALGTLQLGLVRAALAIGTFFLKTAPQAIWDFSLMVVDTIPRLPKIIFDSFVQILDNIHKTMIWLQAQVYDIFTQIWAFIASGGSQAMRGAAGDIKAIAEEQLKSIEAMAVKQVASLATGQGLSTNLLDGLKSEEKRLAQEIGKIGGDLGAEFNRKFNERISALKAPTIASSDKEKDSVNKLATSLSSVADSQSTIAQQLQATESRLLTRGQVDSPMQSVAAASAKTAVAVEKTQTASERMVTLLEELLGKNFVIAEKV